ncbi:MAG: LuxR family transcriptional regulator [Pseudomonadota bacterium]|nr:LuxR family transcriptional regulator [Pseudomonadota bacterium]
MQEKLFRVQSLVEDRNDYTVLSDFERILKAPSLDTLGREVRRVTRHLGFEHFLYGIRHVPPEGETCQFILSGYPTEWMNHYQSEGYADIDPVVAHSYRYAIPLVWREETFDSPERKLFMEDARSYGLGSGLSVPIGTLSNEMALVSIANPEINADARTHSAHVVGTVYVMSAYLHEAVRRLVLAPPAYDLEPPILTPRELECLRRWANGKTAVQIGDLMKISVSGVHFHMQNIRRKLGVRSKHQAIARAILQGLINP